MWVDPWSSGSDGLLMILVVGCVCAGGSIVGYPEFHSFLVSFPVRDWAGLNLLVELSI